MYRLDKKKKNSMQIVRGTYEDKYLHKNNSNLLWFSNYILTDDSMYYGLSVGCCLLSLRQVTESSSHMKFNNL